MTKFNIGDKVIIIKKIKGYTEYKNEIGIIDYINEDDYPYSVIFEELEPCCFKQHELQLFIIDNKENIEELINEV